jgi:class 3 adenylate cyclase/tetratricopeptide (TPR) repeat protein
MRCRTCGTQLGVEEDVCSRCGSRLYVVCPGCGFRNPSKVLSCEKCGGSLVIGDRNGRSDRSFEEQLVRILRFLPTGTPRTLLGGAGQPRTHHSQATVLLAGIIGRPSGQEDKSAALPESLLQEVVEILGRRVLDFGGTAIELSHRDILAVFGIPVALERAPQIAIRCALEMRREIDGLSETRGQGAIDRSLGLRIGMHTGPVVGRGGGKDLGAEVGSVEDTVRMALGVRELAEPEGIYITDSTYKPTEAYFRFEPQGERLIKGRDKPVKVYRVLSRSSRRTRFDLSAQRGLTEFVGREHELEMLLEGFEHARAGKGLAFSIAAEAGVGKSRLLHEFKKAVASEDVSFLEGRCLSYGRNMAYHPIVDMLKRKFDVDEESEDEVIREKVAVNLERLGSEVAWTLPYLLELLSVQGSGIDRLFMSPEATRERIVEAICGLVLRSSQIRPLILAFEDLHWTDRSFMDLSTNLLDSIAESRILLLFTYRPGFQHDWASRPFFREIRLSQLTEKETPLMVSYVLGEGTVNSGLEQFLLEMTEGVPFFIEEFIRSLKELHIIEKIHDEFRLASQESDLPIPDTIQDVIMARVAALPDKAREVLQMGAVIEREFSYRLLREISGLSENEVRSRLTRLRETGLISERGTLPESDYLFRHALTREVVYESIVPAVRRKLHQAVGSGIERVFKNALPEYSGKLTGHYIESGDYGRAARFAGMAAGRARRTAALDDAITYATERVRCLENMPPGEDRQMRLIEARTMLGMSLLEMNHMREARDAVQPILEAAMEGSDKRIQSHIFSILGVCSGWVEEDPVGAIVNLQQALALSEDTEDPASSLNAGHWLGVASSLNCDFDMAEHYHDKALAIARRTNNMVRLSTVMSSMAGWARYFRGKVGHAYETSGEAVKIADECDDIIAHSWAQVSHGMSCHGKGMIGAAVYHLKKGVGFSRRANLFVANTVAQNFLGEIEFQRGAYERARDHFQEAVRLTDQARCLPSWRRLNEIGAVMAEVMLGRRIPDVEFLRECERQNKVRLYEGWIARFAAQVLLGAGGSLLDSAEHWIDKAISADRRNHMMLFLGQDYLLAAQLARRKGVTEKAKESLRQAVSLFAMCGAIGHRGRAETELNSVNE